MKKSKETIKTGGQAATRAIILAAMAGAGATDAATSYAPGTVPLTKIPTESEFRAALREKGIDLVLRRNDIGRIYGATFIDNNSRTVLNGSALGKEFSANALSARFADFSTVPREDLRPTAPALSPAGNGWNQQDAPDNKPSTAQSATPGLSSTLTPEPGGESDKRPAHKLLKEKQSRGRSI